MNPKTSTVVIEETDAIHLDFNKDFEFSIKDKNYREKVYMSAWSAEKLSP